MSALTATIVLFLVVITNGSIFYNPYGQNDVICADNEDCTVIADMNSSTHYFSGMIQCPTNKKCTISCTDSNCDRITINASYSSIVNVSCLSLKPYTYDNTAECRWINIYAESIEHLSIKCKNSKCESMKLYIDTIDTLYYECIDATCSDVLRPTIINIQNSNNVFIQCLSMETNSGSGICGWISTHITTHNFQVECIGKNACYLANFNAIIYENITQCFDQGIQSSSGFDIYCDGDNACQASLFSISSAQNIYELWNANYCKLSTAVIRCGNGLQSFESSVFSVAILGDLQIEFAAAFQAEIYFKPPLLSKYSINSICSSNFDCLMSIYALTAYQITTNCSCSYYIFAPILPIIKASESKLLINDGSIIFTEPITTNDINPSSVIINCNEVNCTDNIYITALFGYTQITSNIVPIPAASCSSQLNYKLCNYYRMKCGLNLQYGPCDNIEEILNQLSNLNIIITQEYDELLQCTANKHCYVYGTRSNTNCPFRSDICNGVTIQCATNMNCSIASVQSNGFSEIIATDADRLILYGSQYGSFSKTIIISPVNGESNMYNLGENGFLKGYINATDSTLVVIGEYGLVQSKIHVQNANDVRIVCENSAGCRNSWIYITYVDMDIANNNVLPYDRICFECYRDAYYPPISNITFVIDNGNGLIIQCVTTYDNIEYKYYCDDQVNNKLYPLDLCHTTQDDWEVDLCDVKKFEVRSGYQIFDETMMTTTIESITPTSMPTADDVSFSNRLEIMLSVIIIFSVLYNVL
eukprot:130685_1